MVKKKENGVTGSLTGSVFIEVHRKDVNSSAEKERMVSKKVCSRTGKSQSRTRPPTDGSREVTRSETEKGGLDGELGGGERWFGSRGKLVKGKRGKELARKKVVETFRQRQKRKGMKGVIGGRGVQAGELGR